MALIFYFFHVEINKPLLLLLASISAKQSKTKLRIIILDKVQESVEVRDCLAGVSNQHVGVSQALGTSGKDGVGLRKWLRVLLCDSVCSSGTYEWHPLWCL